MANTNEKTKEYKAQSIRVMEGLEAVRKRPAMYIGSTGPKGLHHLVYEVVDNSVDEALAGHCDTIHVILHKDGSCSVEDNGRGIPTGIHPKEKISAAEVVLTKLHAGGKFDKDSYKFSGGLHGVGISVVNALSERLELSIFQDGEIHEQSYKRGKPQNTLHVTGKTNKRGTMITFMPDAQIFQETTEFSFETLSARLRELAFLNKSISIIIKDERTDKENKFFFEGGIVSFVEHINKKKTPLFKEIINFEYEDDKYIVDIAMQYNDGYAVQVYSFVNNINTVEGGTHVSGFRSALTKICNRKAQSLKVLKENESFSSDDVREGLVAIISMKVPEPQFEGQTKTKLGNSEVKGVVDSLFFSFLDTYFEENPAIIKIILAKAETARRAREAAKKARDITRRKTILESTILPGKLTDCASEKPSECELFIVEGDSAGGSAKGARDRHNQAVLPLRGKILNVEKARLDRILSNEEIKSLIAAIGGGIGDDFDAKKVRYHKIILMTDADVDGSHICTLLLTFFFRYMRPLIENGYLYIAQPPLYKAKLGRQEQYLRDDKALQEFLLNWAKDQTALRVNNKPVDEKKWQELLYNVYMYDERLQNTSAKFNLSTRECHQLMNALRTSKWHKNESMENLVEKLRSYFNDYIVTYNPAMVYEETNQEERAHITFTRVNSKWLVPEKFFTSVECDSLLTMLQQLANIEDNQWELNAIGKDKQLEGTGVTSLVDAISIISKSYLKIQRYKGLGEMNPDQLGETTVEPATRNTMLQVTIEDALEADNWFSTLMGDDVGGRKEFISTYGQFVKNLDV
jgi:DNA gyrase subunit B